MWYIIAGVIAVCVLVVWGFTRRQQKKTLGHGGHSASVGEYYNRTTTKFLEVYGEIIQAFRTNNVADYLNYTAVNARIGEGMILLDAGCGVCGPAIHFATHIEGVQIEACTISSVQAEMAHEKIKENGLAERVRVTEGDYHEINKIYPHTHFDRVYFLESFGHSSDKKRLIHAAWDVLKPGGMIYIKDLFRREVEDEWEQFRIDQICGQINTAYCYHIGELAEVLSIIRKKGYILHFVKIPEVEISTFEHLTISNDFQNLFDIGKIESWDDYVFPIDFFEILAEKPKYNTDEEKHLYFMNRS